MKIDSYFWYFIYEEIEAKKDKEVNLSKFIWEVSDARIITQALPQLYWGFIVLICHSHIVFGDVSIIIFFSF